MTDKEFEELQKQYYEELRKREQLDKLTKQKKEYQDILRKVQEAKNNPYVCLRSNLVFYISYGDCEGKREIDRDGYELELNDKQLIEFLCDMLDEIDIAITKERRGLD